MLTMHLCSLPVLTRQGFIFIACTDPAESMNDHALPACDVQNIAKGTGSMACQAWHLSAVACTAGQSQHEALTRSLQRFQCVSILLESLLLWTRTFLAASLERRLQAEDNPRMRSLWMAV